MPTAQPKLHLRDHGTWSQRLGKRDFSDRPALFLDRDGVIVEDTNYLHRVEHVRMIPGVGDAIAAANALDIAVVIVTNQSGIGRGYFSWEQFAEVQDHILRELGAKGASVDLVLACGYHENGLGALQVENHAWRKPQPGMLEEAQARLGIALGSSHIIGDKVTDLQAAMRAGVPGGTLVMTGHGRHARDHRADALQGLKRQGFELLFAEKPGPAISQWLIDRDAIDVVRRV